ncbi:hypothetical protein D3C75_663610 [compost metagenome]
MVFFNRSPFTNNCCSFMLYIPPLRIIMLLLLSIYVIPILFIFIVQSVIIIFCKCSRCVTTLQKSLIEYELSRDEARMKGELTNEYHTTQRNRRSCHQHTGGRADQLQKAGYGQRIYLERGCRVLYRPLSGAVSDYWRSPERRDPDRRQDLQHRQSRLCQTQ